MSRAPLSLSAALLALLTLPGCGAQGNRTPVSHASTQLHDAIAAPKATVLHRGMSVRVRASIQRTVGWQVACIARGKRVTVEAVRGQRTDSGDLANYAGRSPAISVTHNRDGSITVNCR